MLGQAKLRPVVIDGELATREIITMNATIDHRVCDGAALAAMVKAVNTVFEDPESHFGSWTPATDSDTPDSDETSVPRP